MPLGNYQVKKISHVCYYENPNDEKQFYIQKHKNHHLDLFLPQISPSSELPKICIFVHGGGWKRGNRRFYGNVGKMLASHGYASAVISYRLTGFPLHLKFIFSLILSLIVLLFESPFYIVMHFASYTLISQFFIYLIMFFFLIFPWLFFFLAFDTPQFRYFDQVYDIANAIKWIYNHAEDYGYNKNAIVLIGHSAGAHLVTLLALDNKYFQNLNFDHNKCIKGVVSISGPFNLSRLNKNLLFRHWYLVGAFGLDRKTLFEASPLSHVKKTPYSFLLLNAQFDFHLTKDSKDLQKSLSEQGTVVEMNTIPWTSHDTIVRLIGRPFDQTSSLILSFLKRIFQSNDS